MSSRAVFVVAAAIAATAIGLAAPSHADDDPASDETFGRLLDDSGLLFNFRLEKYQGQRYCESIIDGQTPLDAIHDLMRDGAYSFDIANGITSAAGVAYCTCAFDTREGIPVRQDLCRPFELNYGRPTY
ncbi:DUF732 domain-containing protein [Mycobacterium mantenii]|uniref:DUF732 domain-containing protein n=1 Tax=Mycobacterium mantenii TaxID=560555 RepID=UPI0009EDCF03|nr:DUF732 domain-containing protein [Mycobacterium mantenii]